MKPGMGGVSVGPSNVCERIAGSHCKVEMSQVEYNVCQIRQALGL